MPGPPPNRSEDLARPRERKGSDQVPVTKGVARTVTIPEPDENWHPIATMIWEGLTTSGQSDFFQNSDWAYAYHVCEELSSYKQGGGGRGRNGQILTAISSALSNLLVTEADRRRVRLELDAPPSNDPGPSVAVMNDYRARLSAVPDLPKTDEGEF
jgi:hypothetical protein